MLIAQCQFTQNYLEIRVGIFDLEKPKEVGANECQSKSSNDRTKFQ